MADSFEKHQIGNRLDNLTANIYGTGDLIVELKYCKWAVHKDVFKSASTVFEQALREDRWQEGCENYIKLYEDNPIMFARCIQFLYKDEYTCKQTRKCDNILEWYDCDVRCTETLHLPYLVAGEPVRPPPVECGTEEGGEPSYCAFLDRAWFEVQYMNHWMRLYSHMPTTNREADIQAHQSFESATGTHISMYLLADKYGISSLQEYALTRLSDELVSCEGLYDAINHLDRTDSLHGLADVQLKRMLARSISSHYREIDGGFRDEDDIIKDWLSKDDDIWDMVSKDCPSGDWSSSSEECQFSEGENAEEAEFSDHMDAEEAGSSHYEDADQGESSEYETAESGVHSQDEDN